MTFTPDRLHPLSAATARAAADAIRGHVGAEPPALAMVLGTGLGPLVDALEGAVAVDYGLVPGFPRSGVTGHAGRLVAGRLEGQRVVMLQGRSHYYEAGDPAAMRVPRPDRPHP